MRFAVIGCGEAGSRRAAAIDSVESAEVIVCVDMVRSRAENLARRFGADSSTDWRSSIVRADVDAVVIATSNNLHAAIALASAEAGKHILCERPLARNPSEGARMIGAAQEYKVRLRTGFSRRYHPAVIKTRNIINEGRIGRILFIRGRTSRGGYTERPADWMVDCELSGGGTLLDNGMDLIDLCRFFMGDFKQVTGRAAALMLPIEPCEDNAFAILTTSDNRSAIIHSSWTDCVGYLSMDLSGTEGYIKLDYDNATVTVGLKPGEVGAGLEEVFDLSLEPDRSLAMEVEDMVHAVAEGRRPMETGLDGQEALTIAHAVYRSSDTGTVVRV
ncbi:MAG: Gfo/Idh/MocA family oxidoreductase [Armatimonadota bacterium]